MAEDSMFLTRKFRKLNLSEQCIKSHRIKELMRFCPGIKVLLKSHSSLHVVSTSQNNQRSAHAHFSSFRKGAC